MPIRELIAVNELQRLFRSALPLVLVVISATIGFSLAAQERVDPLVNAPFQVYRTGIVNVGTLKRGQTLEQTVWLGTGFLVDKNCTYATALHLFPTQGTDDLIVIRFQLPSNPAHARSIVARMHYQSADTDLAFLRIDTINNKPCQTGSLHIFPLFSGDADNLTGEPVWVIGHPKIGPSVLAIPILRAGLVASTEVKWNNKPMLLLDLTGVPGFSGSPVILQKTGEVIGVVYGPGPTERQFGFEWATLLTPNDYERAKQTQPSR